MPRLLAFKEEVWLFSDELLEDVVDEGVHD
jgi:hypothetical protein